MAEIVASAVASEAVSRVSSFIPGDKTSHESVEDRSREARDDSPEDPEHRRRLGRSPDLPPPVAAVEVFLIKD
jgi:hypothetical protein